MCGTADSLFSSSLAVSHRGVHTGEGGVRGHKLPDGDGESFIHDITPAMGDMRSTHFFWDRNEDAGPYNMETVEMDEGMPDEYSLLAMEGGGGRERLTSIPTELLHLFKSEYL